MDACVALFRALPCLQPRFSERVRAASLRQKILLALGCSAAIAGLFLWIFCRGPTACAILGPVVLLVSTFAVLILLCIIVNLDDPTTTHASESDGSTMPRHHVYAVPSALASPAIQSALRRRTDSGASAAGRPPGLALPVPVAPDDLSIVVDDPTHTPSAVMRDSFASAAWTRRGSDAISEAPNSSFSPRGGS
eukprot:TRINITY_DN93048_c0_g1_i1.p1 TRINITY_DN93048_c0_g1~~TRINITY_DN93048_c0_g1_i1.p1  ORF type:complete len:193 (+),score=14.25 TRINITY_DN93048_c0_g1_i1:103-681(+)